MAGNEKISLAAPMAPMTPMERQLALESASQIDPGVSRFSLRAFHASFLLYDLVLRDLKTPLRCTS